MKKITPISLALLLWAPLCGAAEDDGQATQAKLDADCEAARQRVLAPEREKYVAECVQDGMKDSLEACERFYRDYGERSGSRPALYYDLPECVAAFDYHKSDRQ
jgi:hypothetical protein